MMESRSAVPIRHLDLDTPSYLMHRRPRHPEVVLNDGDRGLFLLNLQSGQRSRTIPYSPEYTRSGPITQWCFQDDGNAALLINVEDLTGCYLTLDGTVRHDVVLPFPSVRDVRYLWHGESLWLTSGPARPWHRLMWIGGKPTLADVSRLKVRAAELSWWRALQELPSRSTVLRVESDHDRFLLHQRGSEPGVGVLSWSEPETAVLRTAPFAGQVPRLAYAADTFYVLDEFVIRMVGISGAERGSIPVPDGFEFADIDVVGTTLVVLGNPLDNSLACRVWWYPLGS